MDFELDKFVENAQQKINQILNNEKSSQANIESGLSTSEAETLNEELSGEYISAGFTDSEAEELSSGLSGQKCSDVNSQYNGNTNLYNGQNEGFLELTPDSLQFFMNKYPNISKACINNGVITLLDCNNQPILDEVGNPVTISYDMAKSSGIALVSFYLSHLKEEFDINKMYELQALQDKIDSMQETDENYSALLHEAEVQKLGLMNEDERKNYMTTKMWNAFNKDDKTAWFNAISEFYDYKCRVIDKKFGIIDTKEFLKDKINFNAFIAYIDKIVDGASDKLTKTELAREITKGIGTAIELFMAAQKSAEKDDSIADKRITASISKFNPILEGGVRALFGDAWLDLVKKDTDDNTSVKIKNQSERAGVKLSENQIESLKEEVRSLNVKQIRSKINECFLMDEIDAIKEVIAELSCSKAEKQMLRNECAKQQGEIQKTNLKLQTLQENTLSVVNPHDLKINDLITAEEKQNIEQFGDIKTIPINDEELFKDFVTNRTYTPKDLNDLTKKSNIGYGKDILSSLCKQQEYSTEDIFNIMDHTLEHSVDLTKKILGITNLTSKEKVDLIVSIDVRDAELKNLISVLVQQENLNIKTLPKILDAVKIIDKYDSSQNNGRVDPKKLDKYTDLIQNPKTSPWVIEMLNTGWDIETISKLTPTKQAFYMEKINGEVVEVKDKNVKFFMDFGLEVKEAESVVKAISQNGSLNSEMQKTAVDLINAGIPNNKIGQILSSAAIMGEFNPRVPADAMAIKDLGLNAFVEKYLPIVNNLSSEDIAVKFNPKTKKQLITMIENIPESKKPALRAKGFDLEGAVKKLKTKVKQSSDKGEKGMIQNGFRTKSSVTGFEKIVIDKYKPSEKIWRSPKAAKLWAEEKYQAIKNSAKETEQAKNKQRTENLKAWFEFMETDAEVKNNPFARVLLSEFITKDLFSENSSIPPEFDKTFAKQILSEALKSDKTDIKERKPAQSESAKQNPEFEKTKDKLTEHANKKDYKSILEMMGIKVKTLPDGTWEISHYASFMKETALSKYGISENELLANVSKIKGNADFKSSNATSLPNLEEVDGELNFGDADISNLKKLKKIKDKTINW